MAQDTKQQVAWWETVDYGLSKRQQKQVEILKREVALRMARTARIEAFLAFWDVLERMGQKEILAALLKSSKSIGQKLMHSPTVQKTETKLK